MVRGPTAGFLARGATTNSRLGRAVLGARYRRRRFRVTSDDEHGAGGVMHAMVADRADEQVSECTVSTGTDGKKIR